MNLVFCKSLGISVSPFYLHFLLSSQFPYPGPRPTSYPITPQTRFQDPIENDPFSDSCLSVGRSTGHRGAVFEIFDPGGHRAQRSGQDLGEGRLALRFDLPTNIREPNQRAHGGTLRAVGEDEQSRETARGTDPLQHLSNSAALPGGVYSSRIGKGAPVARPAGAWPRNQRQECGAWGWGVPGRGGSLVRVRWARGPGSGPV
ncbi:PREDICTED: uncharacterized protein LOC105597058 [Cercocebus atys]|uniref:uncharacterized protein LOC105597058 n=1 Tax=Cercocebus atys TaxID=9531 RepID=UPI0005F48391|nr:PREDICTED: uncharacterized protein LOC105597058 [Cercocebus atys]